MFFTKPLSRLLSHKTSLFGLFSHLHFDLRMWKRHHLKLSHTSEIMRSPWDNLTSPECPRPLQEPPVSWRLRPSQPVPPECRWSRKTQRTHVRPRTWQRCFIDIQIVLMDSKDCIYTYILSVEKSLNAICVLNNTRVRRIDIYDICVIPIFTDTTINK